MVDRAPPSTRAQRLLKHARSTRPFWVLAIGLIGCTWSASNEITVHDPQLSGSDARDAERRETELTVVTFNTWMVPFRDTRGLPTRVADAIAKLDADVVALQEVWRDADARRIATELETHGYRWHRWRASSQSLPFDSAGLMISSRRRIIASSFDGYDAGGWPLVLWQPDWLSEKGILSVDIATVGGPITIVTTHAQADYQTHDYESIRTSQMAQLASVVRDVEHPLVVAGDLNVRRGELGHATLIDASSLSQLESDYGVDSVLFRGTATVAMQEVDSMGVLEADDEGRLSDHRGVRATLALRPQTRTDSATAIGPSPWLRAAWQAQSARLWVQAAAALLCAVLLGIGTHRLRRSSHARGWGVPRTVASIVFGTLALWCIYVATVYTPVRARWLADASHQAGVDR